jgi:hypothetical protein
MCDRKKVMSDLTLDQIYNLAMQLDPDARRRLVERLSRSAGRGCDVLSAPEAE